MINDYMAGQLAGDATRASVERAQQSRLATLARCCRPSVWAHLARRAYRAARRATRSTPARTATVCCA